MNENDKHILLESYKRYTSGAVPKKGQAIPKIIHQIWLGSEFPDAYKAWQQSFLKHNPGWEYKLWTDVEVSKLKLINQKVYDETKNFGAKSDLLRCEILYKYGGVYADTDFECFGSFEKLHQTTDFYACLLDDSVNPMLPNSIFGSIPGHPILKTYIDKLQIPVNTRDASLLLKLSDGPFFTDCFLRAYEEKQFLNVALPYTFFYPFPAALRHARTPELVKGYIKSETIAVHYWEVSWHPKKNIIEKILQKILPRKVKEKLKKVIKY